MNRQLFQTIFNQPYIVFYKGIDVHTASPSAFYFATSEEEAIGKFFKEFPDRKFIEARLLD